MASGWWKSTHTNLALGSPVDFTVASPTAPRNWDKIASVAASGGFYMGGAPCTVIDDKIYYASDNYTQGTDNPAIYRYDGRISTLITTIPAVGVTPAKAILSIVADSNGDFYVSTWDSGTTSANFTGRVFYYANGVLDDVSEALFTAGKLPYALVPFNDMLYVGVTKQDPSAAVSVYAINHKVTRTGTSVPVPVFTNPGATYTYYGQFGATYTKLQSTTNDATLDGSNYNSITWTGPAADGIYRLVGGATQGLIAGASSSPFSDTGLAATPTADLHSSYDPSWNVTAVQQATATTTTYLIGAVVAGIEYLGTAASVTARATLTATKYVSLSWTAVSGATSYKIYRTAGHSSTGLIGSTASTTFNDTGLAGTGSLPVASTAISVTGGGCSCAIKYGSDLYVGTNRPAATFASVYKVTTGNVLSTSNTAAPGGTATAYNGYTAAVVWKGNLYMAYWNNDTPKVTAIHKYDGATWSVVKTITNSAPFLMFADVSNTSLWAYGGGDGTNGILYSSTNGTVWTDQSSLLPSAREGVPFMGSANVLGGF